ncbi:hypothetical protein GCM10028803_00310 [Larkinella knui]|uniref:ATP-dependent Clp protease proteolytic subunit n=1 Tax=Larkinella knui TaxID=2025310 RepID=A0A3P1CJM9_9BACT|nr:Clp protease ClpP [Larkinella knui]RRB13438.1 Clp protease ClpP [Larkinella knui]
MATVLTITAKGDIYPDNYYYYDGYGISLTSIQNQINAAGDIDEIVIMIDSYGGQMEEGWKIVDYLLSLGKPIKTVVVGCCYSMATCLFLCGTERLISPNSELMIHLPAFDPYDNYIGGNKFDLEGYVDDLVKAESKALKFYVERTNKEESVLAEMMAASSGEGTYMTADEAVTNGFATGIYQSVTQTSNKNRKPKPVFAMQKYGRPERKDRGPVAQQSSPAIPTNSKTIVMSKVTMLAAAIMSVLGIADGTAKIKNMDVALQDGSVIIIDTTGDAAAIGDKVTLKADGSVAPDGDYKTADGQTITVLAGVISNIVTTENGETTSTEPVNSGDKTPPAEETATAEEITNLRNEVTRLKGIENDYNDFKARTVPVLASMQKALGMKVSKEPETATNTVRGEKKSKGDRADMLSEREEIDWKKRRTEGK